MKTREFNLGHRFHLMVLILLLGVFSPLGCANGPKRMFSKVWGPDRVPFKELVGLGDAARKNKSGKQLASKQNASKKGGQSGKLAQNERKSFGQKIGGAFGKVFFAGFGSPDEEEEKLAKAPENRKTNGKTLTADARKAPGSGKTNENPFNKTSEQTRSAEALAGNNALRRPEFDRNPTDSQLASKDPHGSNSSESNPFAEFLEKEKRNQFANVEQAAANYPGGNTQNQEDNPFARQGSTNNESFRTGDTKIPGENQFVAEFDKSWDQLHRERELAKDDEDDLDELDELDDTDEMESFKSFASSGRQNPGQQQDPESIRLAESRKRVDRLMTDARIELSAGREEQALNIAQYAEELALNEGVSYGADEERPGDFIQSIRERLNNNSTNIENLTPANSAETNPFAFSQNATRENGNTDPIEEPRQAVVKTNPFIRSGDPHPGFVELPKPPVETAETPEFEIITDQTEVPSETVIEQPQRPSTPSVAELQTEIVEISDPYGGMVVDSETVPDRIPTKLDQSAPEPTSQEPVRSADAKATKYRYPKTVPSFKDRHRSWTPLPAATEQNREIKEQPTQQQQLKPNRGSSLKRNHKRVNSNQGASIIRTEYEASSIPVNDWHPSESDESNRVEPAALNVIEPQRLVSSSSVETSSPETPVSGNERFYQMGGQSGKEAQASTPMSEWDNESQHKAGSDVAALRERLVIIFCIAAACIIGFGIRRRFSLRVLRQKWLSR